MNRFDTARLANLASSYIRNRDRRALAGLPLLTINDIVGAWCRASPTQATLVGAAAKQTFSTHSCVGAPMADIVILNPRFDISFWGLEHCSSCQKQG